MQNQNKGYAAQEKKDLLGDMPIDKVASGGSWMSKHVSSPLAMGKGMQPRMEEDKSPLLQRKKRSQLERANDLVRQSQSDVDASRATFGTKDVDESFDRKLNVLNKRVAKANSLGSDVDYDTTDASDAGEKRSSKKSSTLIPQAFKPVTADTASQIRYPDPRE